MIQGVRNFLTVIVQMGVIKRRRNFWQFVCMWKGPTDRISDDSLLQTRMMKSKRSFLTVIVQMGMIKSKRSFLTVSCRWE